MKLSAAYLTEELQKSYSITVQGILSLTPHLNRPLLCTEQTIPQEGQILILDADCMLSESLSTFQDALIYFIGENPRPLPGHVCRIEASVTKEQLFNHIQAIFDRAEQWYEALLTSRIQGSSIQQMLEISAPFLGNPLMVIGMDFVIIASVGSRNSTFHENVLGSSENSYHQVVSLKKDELYNSVRELNGYFFYPKEITGQGSLCVNLKRNGKTTHRLLQLEEKTSLRESQGFLMEILASLVEHALEHNTMHRINREQDFRPIFTSILNDPAADYVTMSQRLTAVGWSSSNFYFCFILEITDLDQKNLTALSITSYLENLFPHSCSLIHGTYIVTYLNMTLAQLTVEDITRKLHYFVHDSNLQTGYSRMMLGHMNLRRQYIQAKIALKFGKKQTPSQWIHPFNEISFDYILSECTRRLPGYMISHERLLQLKYSDEAHHTDYFHTLKVYLDHHMNAVQTAKELYIHRSTFLYRLDKIKQALCSDLDNPDELLYLMLSFHFIEMEKDNASPSNT